MDQATPIRPRKLLAKAEREGKAMGMSLPFFLPALVCAIGLAAGYGAEKTSLPAQPEQAWKQVEEAAKPPPYPAEWGGKPPTPEQRDAFQKTLGTKSAEAAIKAREFHTRFPEHAKAETAREQEKRFIQQALNFGATNLPPEIENALPEDERLKIRLNALNRRAMAKQPQGVAAVMSELESGLRELMKQHPSSPVPWAHLTIVAQNTPEKDHSKKLLAEIADSPVADDATKARVKGILRTMGAIGRPLELSFTATDGSQVDVQKMRGKVVLIDFWASWCGPCIASFPEIVKLYETYHKEGLEILGINMDKTRPAMDGAIERFQLPWKQFYDGQGWGNKFALEYNVSAIPAMWLVDKKGILRTTEARAGLEDKVKELLAESDNL
jgi:thiol-disulfide isomerase/thioredoxin